MSLELVPRATLAVVKPTAKPPPPPKASGGRSEAEEVGPIPDNHGCCSPWIPSPVGTVTRGYRQPWVPSILVPHRLYLKNEPSVRQACVSKFEMFFVNDFRSNEE